MYKNLRNLNLYNSLKSIIVILIMKPYICTLKKSLKNI